MPALHQCARTSAPCCRCEPFNLPIGQIFPSPHRCIGLAAGHCSIFDARRYQPELGFCNGFRSPLRTNCSYNDPQSNSLKVSIGLSMGGAGPKKVVCRLAHRTSQQKLFCEIGGSCSARSRSPPEPLGLGDHHPSGYCVSDKAWRCRCLAKDRIGCCCSRS